MALTAGMASPATAIVTTTTASSPGTPNIARVGGEQRIPLVTGDTVTVDAKGRIVRFEPAKGRERVPVQVQRTKDSTLVIPADAQRLLATGRLDQRLFDVKALAEPRLRKSHGAGLKLIVQYEGGAATARADVRAAGDTQVRRTFPTINADAIRTSPDDTARVWDALTDQQKPGIRVASAGIRKVWLDGVREASLDRSTSQIGADKAWESGYDGTGVKIAVLDTGVDKTHDDLKTQVVAEKNFSRSPDAVDRVGHGTHVASIAAGTGAKSGGTYKGVAPGAKVISGKVLDDEGFGSDSDIIAGMEWAAAEGADVVNLSLGSPDGPDVDPLEETVDRLTAEKGVLFAVAAGNDGRFGASSLSSPGSADAALTVGAVDKDDVLASFSGSGPRAGDGAVKPDVTAPGVDIAAAAAPGSLIDTDPDTPHPAPGYLQIDGTSMATPHVAGAAALLKQKNPGWKSAELKGALSGSATPGTATVFQQGTGRVQVDKALGQSVVAEQVSQNFGTASWPHADDKPVTRKVTYRNLGTTAVTLDLSMSVVDPAGKPAPAGFFTLGASKVTVPAGGTAGVDLVADTRIGDTDGAFAGYVTATGGGQSVRTTVVAVREVESYDLTLRTIDRDGTDAEYFYNFLVGVKGLAAGFSARVDFAPGSHTIRVPKGSYALDTGVYQDPSDLTAGTDWIAQPELEISGDTTVTPDARTAKPVDITVPGVEKAASAELSYMHSETDAGGVGSGWYLSGLTGFRTAHVGPAITDGSLTQFWSAYFLKDATTQYAVAFGGPTNTLGTGYTRQVKANELATLKVGLGASVAGKSAGVSMIPVMPDGAAGEGFWPTQTAPGVRTVHVSTADGVKWNTAVAQLGEPDEWGLPAIEGNQAMAQPKRYEAGRTYQETFNTGVIGPVLSKDTGVFRTAPHTKSGRELIVGALPLLGDGAGHQGDGPYTSATTTLYRDGVKVAENDDPLRGAKPFTVDSADAAYRLTTSVERPATVAATSTRIDTSFSFRSKQVAETTALPVSMVGFAPPVDLSSRAPAGLPVVVPVTVQGSAAGSNLKSLAVSVSYDGGKTWKATPVLNGTILVKSPAKDAGIALSAEVTDKQGNASKVTIQNAWLGK